MITFLKVFLFLMILGCLFKALVCVSSAFAFTVTLALIISSPAILRKRYVQVK